MAQGEFWVERQNWARWPRVLKVNRVTDSGTETRRYVRKGADWEAKDYATRKISELQAENAKLRELVEDMLACINNVSAHDTYCWDYCDFCKMYITKGRCDFESRMRELGVET